MTASIPVSHRDILLGKNFAHLATLMPGGSPQVTPVWVDLEGDLVVFNTAEGRQKLRNLDRDRRVAISVLDHENPYRYLQVRGVVVEKTTAGADEHIDRLAKKYMGVDRYPYRNPAERRVIYKVRPLHVQTMG
ncbi:MAG: PPOX class F420-dependent oxidoreductase [Dehalococcoidia bacterium]|nr:PPOX class F420-dependent oxidoreductase [Dehalococcoidia bacterium]